MKLCMSTLVLSIMLQDCVDASSILQHDFNAKTHSRKGVRGDRLRRNLKGTKKSKKGVVAELHADLIDKTNMPVLVDAWKYDTGIVEGTLYTEICRPQVCVDPATANLCEAGGTWVENCVLREPIPGSGEVLCGDQCPDEWYDDTQYDQSHFTTLDKEVEIDCLNYGHATSCVNRPYDWIIVSGMIVSGGSFVLNSDVGMYTHYAFRQGQDFAYDNGVAAISLPCHFITYIECNCVASYVHDNFPWRHYPVPSGECRETGSTPNSCSTSTDYDCFVVCPDQGPPCGATATPLCEALTIEYIEGANNLFEGYDLFAGGAPTDPGTMVEIIIH